jgi:pyridoxamine 5'-phosphate oxidase
MSALSHIPDVSDPATLFRGWFDEAVAHEPDVPDAMSLATASPDGKPSVRMVLLKGFDERGFVFYTNAQSHKGEEIAANPHAALCLHWKSLGRQVRAEGTLSFVSDADADAYWASRPRASQVAAWASDQSRTLPNRATLQKRVEEADARFAGKSVPRPAHWKGYCLNPQTIEFWLNLPNRLHERLVFHRAGKEWRTERLYP